MIQQHASELSLSPNPIDLFMSPQVPGLYVHRRRPLALRHCDSAAMASSDPRSAPIRAQCKDLQDGWLASGGCPRGFLKGRFSFGRIVSQVVAVIGLPLVSSRENQTIKQKQRCRTEPWLSLTPKGLSPKRLGFAMVMCVCVCVRACVRACAGECV